MGGNRVIRKKFERGLSPLMMSVEEGGRSRERLRSFLSRTQVFVEGATPLVDGWVSVLYRSVAHTRSVLKLMAII